MKMQLLFAVTLCLMVAQQVDGQNPTIINYPGPFEKYLDFPNYSEGTQIIPVGIDLWDGNEVNTIYYGKTPANSSNKPVLLFVHGYASNAQVFFKGDDNMYADVYRDGYRSAYVSLTPNDDMWTNGAMLATMITQIKSNYGNDPLVLIGWSKGGVDIDAALVHFGANDQVAEVFTLSTPHFGTGIAELANSVLLSLINIIFMQNNDATLSLQRGYMNYFRSITDNHPNNTVPYTTIGGWGNGPLNRLDIPQGILHLMDGSKASGGNDGVVPYASSIRPGAIELFDGLNKYYGFLGIPYYDGPDETNLDHFEVTRGNKVWPHIKSSLEQSNARSIEKSIQNFTNPNQLLSSKMQWISGKEKGALVIGSDNHRSQMILLSENTNQSIKLADSEGQITEVHPVSGSAKGHSNELVYELANIKAGRYYLVSPLEFAVLIEEGGPEMILTMDDKVLRVEETGSLGLNVSFKKTEDQGIEINTHLIPVADLALNRHEPIHIPLTVLKENDKFGLHAGDVIEDGIYQLIIRAKNQRFQRDLLTSVSIVNSRVRDKQNNTNDNWIMYPNPAQGVVVFHLDDFKNPTVITIYAMNGVKVFQKVVPAGLKMFDWHITPGMAGFYLVELQRANGIKESRKLVILDR